MTAVTEMLTAANCLHASKMHLRSEGQTTMTGCQQMLQCDNVGLHLSTADLVAGSQQSPQRLRAVSICECMPVSIVMGAAVQ